jgi:hypothetical protein
MDGIKEEERPDALVEVVATAAEAVERTTFGEELVDGDAVAQGIQRQIALVPAAGDDAR